MSVPGVQRVESRCATFQPGHHNLDEGPITPLRKPQQASYVVVSLLPRLLRLWFLRRPRDALLKG